MMGAMVDSLPPKVKFRKLRLAWSAASAIACVSMVALWIHSIWFSDHMIISGIHHLYFVESARGNLWFNATTRPMSWSQGLLFFKTGLPLLDNNFRTPSNFLGFHLTFSAGHYSIIPHWFVAAIATASAAIPWIRWRFSLRTMLIMVAAIAVLLGLARLATFAG